MSGWSVLVNLASDVGSDNRARRSFIPWFTYQSHRLYALDQNRTGTRRVWAEA